MICSIVFIHHVVNMKGNILQQMKIVLLFQQPKSSFAGSIPIFIYMLLANTYGTSNILKLKITSVALGLIIKVFGKVTTA